MSDDLTQAAIDAHVVYKTLERRFKGGDTSVTKEDVDEAFREYMRASIRAGEATVKDEGDKP